MIHLFVIGKYKNKHFEELEKDYLKRFSFLKLTIHELKTETDIEKKITQLGAKLSHLYLLDERGSELSTVELKNKIEDHIEKSTAIFFAIGAAMGHSESLKKSTKELISLSPLTLPHKFARLLLVEQLYRVQTLLTNHPYHNA